MSIQQPTASKIVITMVRRRIPTEKLRKSTAQTTKAMHKIGIARMKKSMPIPASAMDWLRNGFTAISVIIIRTIAAIRSSQNARLKKIHHKIMIILKMSPPKMTTVSVSGKTIGTINLVRNNRIAVTSPGQIRSGFFPVDLFVFLFDIH